jgi:phosphatidylserine decarboxylase
VTLYLSPRHYHRIHTPTAGALVRARHVPGALWPVNAAAVSHVIDLFPRNERLIAYLEGPLGLVAVVAVGAYNVGRISAVFDEEWRPPRWASNRRGARGEDRGYAPPQRFAKGEELMAFHLGSTVVMLLEPGVRLRADLAPGDEVRLGTELAYRVSG